MDKRKVIIESCKECPLVHVESDYSADSFETLTKWTCTKLKTVVRRWIDWNDHSKFIPKECPLEKTR